MKSKTDIKRLRDRLKECEQIKEIISRKRDELRNIHSEIEDILESCDSGIEDIESGLRHLASGIDSISEYL